MKFTNKPLLVPILLILLTMSSLGLCGASGKGGGDASSDRILQIESWFNGGDADITPDLVNISTLIQTFAPEGKISAQLKYLITKGLLDDIKQGTYDLKNYCSEIVDGKEVEKSASTLKVDLSANPNQPRPSICVNERK